MEIGIRGGCVIEGHLWFFLKTGNGLCNINLRTGEVKYIISIPGEALYGEFLYEDIKCYGNQLILIPGNASEIAVYDMNTKEIVKISVYTDQLKYKSSYNCFGKFHSAFVTDKWVYFIPGHFPAIIKMNIETFELVYLEDWLEDIMPYYRTDRYFFRKDIVCDDKGIIYLTSLYYNIVLSIDTKSDKMHIVRKGNVGEGCGCSCIAYQNNMFVLSAMNQRQILIFNSHWELKQKIELPSVFSVEYRLDYIRSIAWENYIFYVPFGSNMMLRLDMNTYSLDIIRQWKLDYVPKYEQSCIFHGKLYCHTDFQIDIFNIDGRLIHSIPIILQGNFGLDMMMNFWANEEIIQETEWIQVDTFLKFLNKETSNSSINKHFLCGSTIYKTI